jgi:hypothetical protein
MGSSNGLSDSILFIGALRIARGQACDLRDEGGQLEHGNPDQLLGTGAELAKKLGDG